MHITHQKIGSCGARVELANAIEKEKSSTGMGAFGVMHRLKGISIALPVHDMRDNSSVTSFRNLYLGN